MSGSVGWLLSTWRLRTPVSNMNKLQSAGLLAHFLQPMTAALHAISVAIIQQICYSSKQQGCRALEQL